MRICRDHDRNVVCASACRFLAEQHHRHHQNFDGKKRSLYKDLMNAVTEAKRFSDPEFCGFLRKQGGAGGTTKVLAYEYYETFKQLVMDIREDLSAPDLPVFVPGCITLGNFTASAVEVFCKGREMLKQDLKTGSRP